MCIKTSLVAVALLLPFCIAPANAADASPIPSERLHTSSSSDGARLVIVNMTKNQIVGAEFKDALAGTLAHPIAPGQTGEIDLSATAKACGNTFVDVSFDDDTEARAAIDLCSVRKITLHGDPTVQ